MDIIPLSKFNFDQLLGSIYKIGFDNFIYYSTGVFSEGFKEADTEIF